MITLRIKDGNYTIIKKTLKGDLAFDRQTITLSSMETRELVTHLVRLGILPFPGVNIFVDGLETVLSK